MSQEHLHYDIQAAINGIVINKCWPIQRALVVVIILLYALITIDFAAYWSYTCIAFIENEQNFWAVYMILDSTQAAYWPMVTAASISTVLADLYMVCTIPPGIIHISSCCFDSRFGAAGWFGGGTGLLFCFQYFPWLLQLV